MKHLTMEDMNTLNAISGMLRCLGYTGSAEALYKIQVKATAMIEEAENVCIQQRSECDK